MIEFTSRGNCRPLCCPCFRRSQANDCKLIHTHTHTHTHTHNLDHPLHSLEKKQAPQALDAKRPAFHETEQTTSHPSATNKCSPKHKTNMAPRPPTRNADPSAHLAFRPPPGMQSPAASDPREDSTALAIREKPKPRRANLPVRLMSQTSGVAKKQPSKAPSTPALAERVEHSLAVVARSGDTSNVAISEARPSCAREPAPSVEAPPSRTTVAPRNPRGRGPRWRAGDACDAVDSKFNPMLVLDPAPTIAAPRSRTVVPRNPRGRNPRWRAAPGEQPDLIDPDEEARRREGAFDRNLYCLNQIHHVTPDATLAGSAGAERDEHERRVAESRTCVDIDEENKRRSDDLRVGVQAGGKGYQCDGCRQLITGNRYECFSLSLAFDLCHDCFLSPNAAMKHRQEAGSRTAQEGREGDFDMGEGE